MIIYVVLVHLSNILMFVVKHIFLSTLRQDDIIIYSLTYV